MIANPVIPQTRSLELILVLAVALGLTVLGGLRFGGTNAVVIIGICASVITPALGALVTQTVMSQLRQVRDATNRTSAITVENGQKLGEIKVLVNGQMTGLREEIVALQATNKDVILANRDLQKELHDLRSTSLIGLVKLFLVRKLR